MQNSPVLSLHRVASLKNTTLHEYKRNTCTYYILGEYKLSEDFAKPYFHKYWTEIRDVTTIWMSHHFQRHYQNCESASTPQSGTSHKTCLRGFGGNGSIAWTSAVSHVGRTSNAFKVTMKLQTFLFQMIVTSCISVQYLWKYGFAKSSDNLYATCIYIYNYCILFLYIYIYI